jgi:pSer/pThr/pTyr-binding forkhead associated (FHA) protein
MSLNAKLVVVGGDVKTAEIKLRLPSTIGRGKGTTIILQHPLVSRQHCELYESAGQLMVRDLGSLNGTFVNNQRVTESPLPAGELLTVGTVTFRAVYEAATDDAPSVPRKEELAATKKDARRAVSAPTPKPAPPPAEEIEELEFDFGKPLLPGDDELEAPGGPTHPTEPLAANLEETPKPSKDKTRKPAPGTPAPLAATKLDDETADFSKWDEKDNVDAAEDDDDDLNDFLKNLGEK